MATLAAPGHTRFLEERREREACGRSTRQRHRPGQHAKQRRLPQPGRDRRADDVLEDGNDRREEKEAKHERTAQAEQLQAGGETDRREKRVLERGSQRDVEADELHPVVLGNRDDDRDEKSANNGCRKVEAGEERDGPSQAVAEEENEPRGGYGIDYV